MSSTFSYDGSEAPGDPGAAGASSGIATHTYSVSDVVGNVRGLLGKHVIILLVVLLGDLKKFLVGVHNDYVWIVCKPQLWHIKPFGLWGWRHKMPLAGYKRFHAKVLFSDFPDDPTWHVTLLGNLLHGTGRISPHFRGHCLDKSEGLHCLLSPLPWSSRGWACLLDHFFHPPDELLVHIEVAHDLFVATPSIEYSYDTILLRFKLHLAFYVRWINLLCNCFDSERSGETFST